jgi:hypothetical protein
MESQDKEERAEEELAMRKTGHKIVVSKSRK